MTDPAPLVLRVAEVCTLLDVCENTAYNRIAAQAEPFHNAYREGRTYRIPVADVCAYLSARNVPIPKSLRHAAA
ncbi:MAG: helix-turn-helix domain-containing protein [Mycobacterium sp.]